MQEQSNVFTHNPIEATNYFCIGIGGIGVSALARLLHHLKKHVSGSDVQQTEITDALERQHIHCTIGEHKASHISSDIDVVIYTAAVPSDNPERKKAEALGIPTFSYAEMIGHIMKQYTTIAVSGTHGKTTTTALIGHILVTAKLDPTIIVGSLSKNMHHSNERLGKGKFLVIEADEYKESFLNYHADIAVILNIEADHLDYYRDVRHIISSFKEFSLRVSSGGTIVANHEDQNVHHALEDFDKDRIISFGNEGSSCKISNVELLPKGTLFSLTHQGVTTSIQTSLFGLHNVFNVAAAFCVAKQLRVPIEVIQKAVQTFKGTWRRFDVVGTFDGRIFVDDYAHHPTELRACIASLRQAYPNKKITFVFQPHHENRFTALFDEFVESIDGVTTCILMEIYHVEGRTGVKRADSSLRLVETLKARGRNALFVSDETKLPEVCKAHTSAGEVLAFVGAGDIIRLRQSCSDYFQKHSHGA